MLFGFASQRTAFSGIGGVDRWGMALDKTVAKALDRDLGFSKYGATHPLFVCTRSCPTSSALSKWPICHISFRIRRLS